MVGKIGRGLVYLISIITLAGKPGLKGITSSVLMALVNLMNTIAFRVSLRAAS